MDDPPFGIERRHRPGDPIINSNVKFVGHNIIQ